MTDIRLGFVSGMAYAEIGFVEQVTVDYMTVRSRTLPRASSMQYLQDKGWQLHVQPMPYELAHLGEYKFVTTYKRINQ